MRNHRINPKSKISYIVSACLLLASTCFAGTPAILTFDAPGAVNGTVPSSIAPAGAIAGYYADASPVYHGFFLSALGGTFTSFEAPGAGTGQFQGTLAFSINPTKAIAGYYVDASYVPHGFVRDADGTITAFDAPGAQGTFAYSINPAGAIAGHYFDASGVAHGYMRAANGTITTFDVLGAGTGPGQGTYTSPFEAMNPAGAITGFYFDASNVFHGFVRAANGTITTFDVPGAGTGSFQGTQGASINSTGAIAGLYVDSGNVNHGFVRAPDGTITTFDVLGAGTGTGQGTAASGDMINPAGVITGNYVDSTNVNHGFVRAPDGTITTFDVLGAGTGPGQGTLPLWINTVGTIVGLSIDSSGVGHGFLRTP